MPTVDILPMDVASGDPTGSSVDQPFLRVPALDDQDNGRIIFTQRASAHLNAHAWLDGKFMVPSAIWPMLCAELPSWFWATVSACLSQWQQRVLADILNSKDQQIDKLARFMAEGGLAHVPIKVSERKPAVKLGELLYGHIDFILVRKLNALRHECSSEHGTHTTRMRLLDTDAIRTMFHFNARIGNSFFIEGADREDLANILKYTALHVEPYCSSTEFCQNVPQVATMLLGDSSTPILIGHSHRDDTLDWCSAWKYKWGCSMDILLKHAPELVAHNRLDTCTEEILQGLSDDYFCKFIKTLHEEDENACFDVCVDMRRSFRTTLQLSTGRKGFVFLVHGRLVDRTTLGSFYTLVASPTTATTSTRNRTPTAQTSTTMSSL